MQRKSRSTKGSFRSFKLTKNINLAEGRISFAIPMISPVHPLRVANINECKYYSFNKSELQYCNLQTEHASMWHIIKKKKKNPPKKP